MNHVFQKTTDAAMIAKLHVRELAEQGKEYSPEDVIKKWQSVSGRYFIVSEEHGFVAFQEGPAESCYLSDLYVDPQYRGRGLGRALVRAVKCDHRYVELHVDEGNVAAWSLYESEGFIEVYHREKGNTTRVFLRYTGAQQPHAADADKPRR